MANDDGSYLSKDLMLFANGSDAIGRPFGTISVSITAVNLSCVALPSLSKEGEAGRVFLSYHLFDATSGEVVVWDGVRTALPRDLLPGSAVTAHVKVLIPGGRRDLSALFDLVHEGVGWLSAICNARLPLPRVKIRYPDGFSNLERTDFESGNPVVPLLEKLAAFKGDIWNFPVARRDDRCSLLCFIIEDYLQSSADLRFPSSRVSMLEIGVGQADTVRYLARHFGAAFDCTGVDPYGLGIDPAYEGPYRQADAQANAAFSRAQLIYDEFDARLIRSRSNEYFACSHESFNIVLVNGDHRYASAIQDIESAFAALHPGGLLIVDDYGNSFHSDVEVATWDFCFANQSQIRRSGALPLFFQRPGMVAPVVSMFIYFEKNSLSQTAELVQSAFAMPNGPQQFAGPFPPVQRKQERRDRQMRGQISDIRITNQQLRNRLELHLNTISWKVTRPLRFVGSLLFSRWVKPVVAPAVHGPEATIQDLELEMHGLDDALDRVVNSISWRITWPIRKIRALIPRT